MKWDECLDRRIMKRSSVDGKLIFSLLEASRRRLLTDEFAPMNEITASTKVTNSYDSLREVLEAVSISRGFKIYNHDCFVGFLLEVLKLPKEANRFDKFRKIRNGVNYYGKNVDVVDAEGLVAEINELRVKLLGLLNGK